MPRLFQMQVLSSELPLPLGPSGEPGGSYPDGKRLEGSGTLAGLKLSLSNAWSDTSWKPRRRDRISQYMGITEEWLRAGGMDGAVTEPSTRSSSGCTSTCDGTQPSLPSTQHMSGLHPTQQTHLPEEYTPQHPFSFSQSHSHRNWSDSLLPFTPAEYQACEKGLYSNAATRWFDDTHQRDSSRMK